MGGLSLWLSMVFSCIGAGYVLYARRQREPVALIVGMALCVYPYFIANVYAMVAIGAALMLTPPFIPF